VKKEVYVDFDPVFPDGTFSNGGKGWVLSISSYLGKDLLRNYHDWLLVEQFFCEHMFNNIFLTYKGSSINLRSNVQNGIECTCLDQENQDLYVNIH